MQTRQCRQDKAPSDAIDQQIQIQQLLGTIFFADDDAVGAHDGLVMMI